MKNNKITQIEPPRVNCLTITAALDTRPAFIMQWVKSLLIIIALIVSPGNHAWAATGGFFISASFSEITGGILLAGLSLAALVCGIRLVLQSARVLPTR